MIDSQSGDSLSADKGSSVAQASITDAGVKWLVILMATLGLMFGIAGATIGVVAASTMGRVSERMVDASTEAARAAERADQAERAAKIAEINAKQVFVELNRLGYPVKTPAEPHSVAPEDTQ